MQSSTRSPSPPASVTHLHLLAVVNSEMEVLGKRRVRILDLGCGNGHLIAYLSENLARMQPGIEVSLHGLDVYDHGVQATGFLDRTLEYLSSRAPSVAWKERLSLVSSQEGWPFPDGHFDIIVSNQVLEHVRQHQRLFAETERCLAEGGIAVHLFPLVHYIWEGHLELPWVHRIRDRDRLVRYITFLSRLGFGKFGDHKRRLGKTLQEFSEQHADYMLFQTNYLTGYDALELPRSAGLRASFRYTPNLYWAKLRSMLGLPRQGRYRRALCGPCEWFISALFKYVSSVTLFLEKKQVYRVE